jgi:hypothetical protein
VEPEFVKTIVVVLAVGSLIAGIGTLLLFFAFRAFGGATAGRTSHLALIASVVAFVFACCLMLFTAAYH